MASVSNQIMMNQLTLNAQLLQSTNETSSKMREVASEAKTMNYAAKGDAKYDEAIDTNSDGIISYDEYMQYCKENAVAPNSDSGKTIVAKDSDCDGIKTVHIGKAFEMYSRAGVTMPEAKVSSEA